MSKQSRATSQGEPQSLYPVTQQLNSRVYAFLLVILHLVSMNCAWNMRGNRANYLSPQHISDTAGPRRSLLRRATTITRRLSIYQGSCLGTSTLSSQFLQFSHIQALCRRRQLGEMPGFHGMVDARCKLRNFEGREKYRHADRKAVGSLRAPRMHCTASKAVHSCSSACLQAISAELSAGAMDRRRCANTG